MRSRVLATRRALVLLSQVMDLPAAGRAVTLLTREPRVERLEIDSVEVETVRPGGTGPWPAFVFVNGAHPLRRQEPVVQRLTHGLARAGYLVVAPDLPGLGTGEITCGTLDATVAVAHAAACMEDVQGRRVALVGVSTGASLALLAAGRPEIASRISVVAAVTPFADLERIVCLATTCRYALADGPELPVSDLLRRSVARSLAAALPVGSERDALLEHLARAEDAGAAPAEGLSIALGEEAQAVMDVLTNINPARFPELFAALSPRIRASVAQLSPLRATTGLLARVELAVPPNDEYFPLDEALALAQALPNVRLTVTKTLDHTRPRRSLRDLRDLLRFGDFAVRGLAAAAS